MTEPETAEQKFARLAKHKGWTPIRAGWPDFLLRDQKGRLVFVEVKAERDSLRESQRVTFAALEAAGIKVKIWWEGKPGKLMAWRAFDRKANSLRSQLRALRSAQTRATMYSDEETDRLMRLDHFDS